MSDASKWIQKYQSLVDAGGTAIAAAIAAQGVVISSPDDLNNINAAQVAAYPDVVSANETAAKETGWNTSALAIVVSASLVVGGLGTPWATAWNPNQGYDADNPWSFKTAMAGISVGAFGAFMGGTFGRAVDGMGPVTNVTSYLINATAGGGIVGLIFTDHEGEKAFGWMAGLSIGLNASLPAVGFAGTLES